MKMPRYVRENIVMSWDAVENSEWRSRCDVVWEVVLCVGAGDWESSPADRRGMNRFKRSIKLVNLSKFLMIDIDT